MVLSWQFVDNLQCPQSSNTIGTLCLLARCAMWCTSEAADFDRIERPSLRSRLAHVGRAFPLSQAARVLQLICSEHEADEVAQQPTPVLLRRVHGLVPLLVSDEERIIPQQLLASLLAQQLRVDVSCIHVSKHNQSATAIRTIHNNITSWARSWQKNISYHLSRKKYDNKLYKTLQ